MRFGKLAALGSFLAGLAKRAPRPKKTTVETELHEAPERDRPTTRQLRRARRYRIAHSFTRFLAARPIGDAAVGALGARWRKEMGRWRRRWAQAFKNGTTYRRANRHAIKASRLKAWRARHALAAARRAAR